MNVDLYCQHCSHIIEIICTNLDAYQHSVHKSEYESVTCDRCQSSVYVVIRCYIPRDIIANQMRGTITEGQRQEQKNYEDTALDFMQLEATTRLQAVRGCK